MKPDVKTEPQRSHGSASYLQHHCSSKSKQRQMKLGWKVSFLKYGSDSPTFLTAQTREANPPPGGPHPLRFSVRSKCQAKALAAVAPCSRHSTGPNVFQKGTFLRQPRYQLALKRFKSSEVLLFTSENTMERKMATTNNCFSRAKLLFS